jgi:uncharacterized protein (DUF697 family)
VAGSKLPLAPFAVYKLVKELQAADEAGPLAVGGARELAGVLRRELARGAAPGAVVDGASPARAAALVHVLAGEPTEDDERTFREAHRAGVPVVCVLADPAADGRVPHVLATDVVRVAPGSGFPVDDIGVRVAQRLGDEGPALAARVPVLRRAVCDALIARASRQNGIVGAAVFVPGADLPVLTLNQLRLVLRIGLAHGVEVDVQRWPEILGVILGGLGFRAAARQLLGIVPVAGWAVKGAVAYAGTRALGEAAVRYFDLQPSGLNSEVSTGRFRRIGGRAPDPDVGTASGA